MNTDTLQEAIALAREGRKAEARWLLERVLHDDRMNETAWLWYADCVETQDERLAALESCLRANPNALRARAGLRLLYRANVLAAERAQNAAETGGKAPARQNVAELVASAFVAVTGGSGRVVEPDVQAGPFDSSESELVCDPFTESPDLLFAEVWGDSDGTATGAVMRSEGVFTISPDAVTKDEFAEIEARASTFLNAHTGLAPVHTRQMGREQAIRRVEEDWDDLSRVGSPRLPASHNAPTQPAQRLSTMDELWIGRPANALPAAAQRSSAEPVPTRPLRQPLTPTRRIIGLMIVVLLVMALAVALGAALAIGLS